MTLGMISGTTPKTAYLSSSRATRPSAGMAGKGNPLQFDWFIRAVRSSPVIVSVESEPLSPGAISFFVITPSISTFATPLTVATSTTRMKRSGKPPVSRKRICSGDCLSMLKVNWNPLVPTSFTVTSASASASITARGGVSGKIGPIIRLSCTLLSIAAPRYALGHGDLQDGTRRLDHRVWLDSAIGVAQQPEQERIAKVLGRQQIEPVALLNGVSG